LANTFSAAFETINGIEGYTNAEEVLLVEINSSATSELFATYLGGTDSDFASGIARDSKGSICVVGSTDSADFPVTQGAFQHSLGKGNDAFILKIGPSSASAIALSPGLLQWSLQGLSDSNEGDCKRTGFSLKSTTEYNLCPAVSTCVGIDQVGVRHQFEAVFARPVSRLDPHEGL
jgi:hypothetical protein